MDEVQSPSKRRKDDHDQFSYDHNLPSNVGQPAAYGYSPGPPPQHFYHQPHYSPTAGQPPSYQHWQGQTPHLHHQRYRPGGGNPPMNQNNCPPADYPYEYHNNRPQSAQQSQYRESNAATVPNSSQGINLNHNSHLNYDYPPTRTIVTAPTGSTSGQHPHKHGTMAMLNISSKEVLDAKMQQSISDENTRGSYRCGRCGVPKKGHICPYQPKLKRRIDEPLPEMKNAACQVEMDEFLVLRRLNLEIQGYPETYTSEPIGEVGYESAPLTAYTSTVGQDGEMTLQHGPKGNDLTTTY